jgi:hypothetical protein
MVDCAAALPEDEESAGRDTAMLIDGVSGPAPRREETAELVERRVDEDGVLHADVDR